MSPCESSADVFEAILTLRTRLSRVTGQAVAAHPARVLRAFSALAALWERRLNAGWTPPAGSSFPWAQVRLSLVALLPGFAEARAWLGKATSPLPPGPGRGIALVLAGNTPLLAWAPLAAALLAGHAVFVKQSRDETLWTRLFVESLAEGDAELAALIHLDLWPGDDPRTIALVQSADAVIAYGGDTAIAALRSAVPETVPFFGFGHALSIGLLFDGDTGHEQAGQGFAADVLMYGQGGCLSPHVIFTGGGRPSLARGRFGNEYLPESLAAACRLLDVTPVRDPAVATAVRQARDLAAFDGYRLEGDPDLRWTVACTGTPRILPPPIGHGFVFVIPIPERSWDPERITDRFGAARGRISSVGIAGESTRELRAALQADGVSRVCKPGEMQTPPLDWPNGNIDLLTELLKIGPPPHGEPLGSG
ncbi:MAG: hypothetical protein H7Z41_19580 [Cytophagales bacterium]|nr:hypothetical protein [Armatimonadota bacterium]